MAVIIKTEELEAVFAHIIEKLKFYELTSIEIDTDFYWEIHAADWDVSNPEPKKIVGSLEEDWELLIREISEEDALISYNGFDRAASVLKAISQEIIPIERGNQDKE